MTDEQKNKSFVDEEKIVSLELAVQFWSGTNQNPNTKPTTIGTVLDTASKFYHYLVN